jgi:hypothetical protein
VDVGKEKKKLPEGVLIGVSMLLVVLKWISLVVGVVAVVIGALSLWRKGRR